MVNRTPVMIQAADPLSSAGLKAQLTFERSVELVGPADYARARVAVLAGDSVDAALIKLVRGLRHQYGVKVAVVAAVFEEAAVVEAVAAGAGAFLRRRDSTPARLVQLILAADQGAGLPEGLAQRVAGAGIEGPGGGPAGMASEPVAPSGGVGSGSGVDSHTGATGGDLLVSSREAEILRLVADGFDTAEVAAKLAYSESTIKSYIAKMMVRFSARNRCHVLSMALEHGLI
jgi:DNA-binding NarL/FixJ family response regulator